MTTPAGARVLMVCTGNVCRSPAAERLLRLRLGPGSGIDVTSAGTGALVGSAIDPPVAELLEARGAETADFTARVMTERIATETDLVLTATREHRAAIVEAAPGAVRRTFTLRELARLAGDVTEPELAERAAQDAARSRGDGAPVTPADRLRALVAIASRRRTQVDPELDDVPDPFRRSAEDYRRAVDLVAEAVDAVADRVLGG